MDPAMKYLLECEMATYQDLVSKKRTPKSAIERHESIIRKAFEGYAGRGPTGRVDAILNGDRHALSSWFARQKEGR